MDKDKNLKIELGTAFIEYIDGNYEPFNPSDKEYHYGDNIYDSPYSLDNDEYYAIEIKWNVYEHLQDNMKFDIQSGFVVSIQEYQSYLFLFKNRYDFLYEIAEFNSMKESMNFDFEKGTA